MDAKLKLKFCEFFCFYFLTYKIKTKSTFKSIPIYGFILKSLISFLKLLRYYYISVSINENIIVLKFLENIKISLSVIVKMVYGLKLHFICLFFL